MRRYKRYDLLIIDELGYLPITADEAKLLFRLINGRYERKSTIITTNVPLSSWGTVLHSTATAEAILDRLVYHSHVIKIKESHTVWHRSIPKPPKSYIFKPP